MYLCLMYSSELLKGTIKTIVLSMLKEQGEMYGYQITQKVKEMTSDKIQITEGALYPTLHALEKSGDLETKKVYIGKRVRKYYKVTEQGSETAEERVSEFENFIRTMEFVLGLKPNLAYV